MHINPPALTLQYIQDIVSRYFVRQPVDKVYLYGSYARGGQTDKSDVDIIVCLDKTNPVKNTFTRWKADLENIFERKVDIVAMPDEGYAGHNYSFIQHINGYKVLLYSKDA